MSPAQKAVLSGDDAAGTGQRSPTRTNLYRSVHTPPTPSAPARFTMTGATTVKTIELKMTEEDRKDNLKTVFSAFDLNESGSVEAAELMCLGEARQVLGQKERTWTKEKNQKMLEKMDTGGDACRHPEFRVFTPVSDPCLDESPILDLNRNLHRMKLEMP